jgi:hypothetical protein
MVGLSQKRALLVVLAVCLAFAAVFAGDFVLANLGHAHPGEPCSVCLQLEAAHHLLEGLGRAGLFLLACRLAPQAAAAVKNSLCFFVVPQTLVGLNIKNNS